MNSPPEDTDPEPSPTTLPVALPDNPLPDKPLPVNPDIPVDVIEDGFMIEDVREPKVGN